MLVLLLFVSLIGRHVIRYSAFGFDSRMLRATAMSTSMKTHRGKQLDCFPRHESCANPKPFMMRGRLAVLYTFEEVVAQLISLRKCWKISTFLAEYLTRMVPCKISDKIFRFLLVSFERSTYLEILLIALII